MAAAIEKYGSVHILIQTASFHDPKPSDGFWSSSAWASSYKATLKGAFKVLSTFSSFYHLANHNCVSVLKPSGHTFARIAGEESFSKVLKAWFLRSLNMVKCSQMKFNSPTNSASREIRIAWVCADSCPRRLQVQYSSQRCINPRFAVCAPSSPLHGLTLVKRLTMLLDTQCLKRPKHNLESLHHSLDT